MGVPQPGSSAHLPEAHASIFTAEMVLCFHHHEPHVCITSSLPTYHRECLSLLTATGQKWLGSYPSPLREEGKPPALDEIPLGL